MSLSGVDNRMYYSASMKDGFRGMISLHPQTIIAIDNLKLTGRDWAFTITTQVGTEAPYTYYLHADTEQDMEDWIVAITKRINSISRVESWRT